MPARGTVIRVWLAGMALAVALSWPLMSAPGSLTRMDTHDGKFSVWNVAWVARTLVVDPTHVFDANIFHPHTGTLAYSEANLVAGAAGAPVYALTRNPILTHNLVVFAALVLAFVLTWYLVFRLTASEWAAYAPAAGFAFSAYVAAHTAHVQLLLVFVVPLVLLTWHRFTDAPGLVRGAWLGAALTFSVLACAYYGIMLGLAVGFAALWFAPGRPDRARYWAGLATAAVVAAVTVAPVAVPYAALRDDSGVRSTLNVDEARSYSADHRTYMRGHSGPLTRAMPESLKAAIDDHVGRQGEVLFPGALLALLALVGIWRRLRSPVGPGRDARLVGFYAGLTVLALWASMGPRAGLYVWLAEVVPFMSFLRAPARFGVLVLLGVSVFAGWGLRAVLDSRRRVAVWGLLALLLVAAEARVPWPLRSVPPVPEAYRMLATLPRAGTLVLQFPYRSGEWFPHVDHMFWSMWHWQPLVNGYSDFIPPDVDAIAVPVNSFPSAEALGILASRGVKYVAVDWRTYNDEAAATMRGRFPPYAGVVVPLFEGPDVSLYEVVGPPEAAATAVGPAR